MTNIVSYNRLIRPFKNIEAPHTNKKLKHEEDKNFLIQNNDEDDDCELNSTIEATDNNDEDVFFSPVNNPKFHYNKLNENKQKITNKTAGTFSKYISVHLLYFWFSRSETKKTYLVVRCCTFLKGELN